ncbi:fibrous sheath CABYR-binding protein-like isoform X2 [Echeneis naucrates]|uniref:fibrous sheath CABYR-binding protein-like isoform X2 n=1 Tax=Echeneis naucrates TaxID=173247 RepID=UPI0011142F66|nr:fibrous sheath CABYR-binding protein-like isoform X2 [Echeneis naucrates]
MFCRRAWQRVGPLARRLAFRPSTRNAPVRHMAFGVPGGSTNMTYVLLCGGGLTAAVVYAYKTVSGDSERHEDTLASMGSPAKASSAPEEAEPTPVEEAVSAIEVISELVPAPMAAETAAEPIMESVSVEASEVIVAEAQAEPAVTEEAAPPAEEEEAAPVVEAEAMVETSDEAPTAESTGTAAVDEVPPAPAAEAQTEPEASEAEVAV